MIISDEDEVKLNLSKIFMVYGQKFHIFEDLNIWIYTNLYIFKYFAKLKTKEIN